VKTPPKCKGCLALASNISEHQGKKKRHDHCCYIGAANQSIVVSHNHCKNKGYEGYRPKLKEVE